jgi:hypothetical protein
MHVPSTGLLSFVGKEEERNSMTAAEALTFIEKRGVVLVSAKGPVPRLTEFIAGQQIFVILEAVTDSDDVLVCRLIKGKITLVHRRLWPALVRLAGRLAPGQIAKVHQEHTASGRHVNKEVPFPDWVPAASMKQAKKLTEAEALAALGDWTKTAL